MNALSKAILKNIGTDGWQSFQDFFPPMRHRVDGATALKMTQNLVARGALEQMVTGGRVFYRVPEPRLSSKEPSSRELEDAVLKARAEDGTLRSGDLSRMRQFLDSAKRREAQEEEDLRERLEEIAQDKRIPDLSYEDVKRIVGLDND